jgi:prepilin-type N-terminal cleavage/methylation domain-containing protein
MNMILINNKGLSLLEVLVAMLVISFGLFGMAPLLVLSIDSNSISRDTMTVSDLAKEQMELYSTPGSIPAVLPYRQVEEGVRDSYHRLTYIYDNSTDTTMADGLANITVAIAWSDNSGTSRVSEFSSLVRKE